MLAFILAHLSVIVYRHFLFSHSPHKLRKSSADIRESLPFCLPAKPLHSLTKSPAASCRTSVHLLLYYIQSYMCSPLSPESSSAPRAPGWFLFPSQGVRPVLRGCRGCGDEWSLLPVSVPTLLPDAGTCSGRDRCPGTGKKFGSGSLCLTSRIGSHSRSKTFSRTMEISFRSARNSWKNSSIRSPSQSENKCPGMVTGMVRRSSCTQLLPPPP